MSIPPYKFHFLKIIYRMCQTVACYQLHPELFEAA